MKLKNLCIAFIFFGSIFSLPADEKINLLIAFDTSSFKTQLSENIMGLAESETYNITVRNSVKKIQDWDLEEFDAVITINRGTAGHMNRKLIRVLEAGHHPPMVVVTSYGDPTSSKDNYSAYNSVDGITTASLKNSKEIELLARDIILKVRELLE